MYCLKHYLTVLAGLRKQTKNIDVMSHAPTPSIGLSRAIMSDSVEDRSVISILFNKSN
jgi:hypothetical protein